MSTTIGSDSGATSVNVPDETVSGRYLESALPSTTTVPRSATAFVSAAEAGSAAAASAAARRREGRGMCMVLAC